MSEFQEEGLERTNNSRADTATTTKTTAGLVHTSTAFRLTATKSTSLTTSKPASKHWPAATIFWQIDQHHKIRSGKIMFYNPQTGKRIKHPFNHITWVHKALNIHPFHLNPEKLKPLHHRHVKLYPDLGAHEKWQTIAASLPNVTVSTILEQRATSADRTQGLDLADYLLDVHNPAF